MKNIFDQKESEELINRIKKLTPETKGLWGKMNAAQMLAHCNVTYEYVYDDKHPKPNGFKKLMLKLFVKSLVVGKKPYKRSSMTAPEFIMVDDKDFENEKDRLTAFIKKTQELGADFFNNKESHSFGPLTSDEWNVMFYKHLDHHLNQFGV
jgi:hypothetical protein